MPELTTHQLALLKTVARAMIPPDPRRGLPGADDPDVMAHLLTTLGRDAEALQDALACLDSLSDGDALETLRRDHRPHAATFERLIAGAYYQDARVLQAVGVPARPPFPMGYDLEQGDLSLLEPVRARGQIYRDA